MQAGPALDDEDDEDDEEAVSVFPEIMVVKTVSGSMAWLRRVQGKRATVTNR